MTTVSPADKPAFDRYMEAKSPMLAADGHDYAVTELPGGYIDGIARMAFESARTAGKNRYDAVDAAYFKVPAISHVEGNLYQGGFVGGNIPSDFKLVVSLYPWGRYEVGPDTRLVEYEMYDAGEIPDEAQIFEAAALVHEGMKEGKTLVHCQAGLNRSGLIAATALILDGRTPTQALNLLRKRSPLVLCNKAFETWLLADGTTWAGRMGL